MTVTEGRLRELTAEECFARLGALRPKIGRIAYLEDGYATVLPVNYGLLDDHVIIRTEVSSRLETALRIHPVSFEVDVVDPTWREGWSVLLRGRAEELTGEALERAEQADLQPWAPGRRGRYVRIVPRHVTGREIL
jgi:uncharacterized protein